MNKFYISSIVVLINILLGLTACTSYTKSEKDGAAKTLVWPKASESTLNMSLGIFPDPSSLEQVKSGLTKHQLYYLLGRPHYSEGFVYVREWNYLFHFHTPGQGENDVTTCQFKVLFDKKSTAQTFYWKAVNPKSGVCPPGGKPESKPIMRAQKFTLNTDALFEFNKAGLKDLSVKGQEELDIFIKQLHELKELNTIIILGHTDFLGSEVYNLLLSQERANSIKHYLIIKGVHPDKIKAIGIGEQQPVKQCSPSLERNKLIACLQPNRRVEIEVNGYGIVN
ncbi:OmpA family protein [Vitreoscilla massiliensis]|uniref:OmpA family protein n=1 Tax=Vitreoscilla massiliensis TaxID=1689272 RepID=A0ABY4DXR2_9NEIS|nr:OmpA family protein [Vitreoscilla massiliensis]UOO88315.1 OmpA family protein [Vitreoscilla massiliensis]